ncbi:MAG: NAD(P)/FAD-dependent oxidoreductase [Leptolyngbyaceae cyanobacterium SM1_1_3]|nr:NAD(P)/FAD-dependent oxidoreductase [Leptolyngbyaceae cyanobacterium SM1_1_3]NJN04732.1 NAD(P)/FAD-dependent oxidoreductase [Leptolyngbyaceae cyanobacterium RM1_1_2]NJO10921.1 NAD(P)/FAD-dependent oxidoreductase [Leptolyngbyaceae cyanobacterium SL_1_1]
MTQSADKKICILGGGFGGLYTALSLSKLPWLAPHQAEIVLVDQRDRFLFSPLLYELVTEELQTWEIAPPYEELLANTSIRFHQSGVEALDASAHQVALSDGTVLPYDRLVLAMGGETPMDLAPGVADHAIPFRTIEDAYRLKERLRELEASPVEKIRIAVVGGGYSGVELACKLADRLGDRGRIRIVEMATEILKTSSEFNRQAAEKALSECGVWLDLETTVESVSADAIALSYREQVDTIPVELVLWTVGTRAAEATHGFELKRNPRGQIVVEPTLQVSDHSDIFALGDLVDCHDATGQQVPNTAQSAIQQADYAAWNVWAALSERPLLPFKYNHLGEMMTLGTDNATLTGLGLKLDGTLAHVARRLAYLYRMPTLDHQIRVGLNWMGQPLRDLLKT